MLDVRGALVLARSGLLAPTRPDRLLGMGLALARWGLSPAAGYAAAAARHPTRVALVDDEGPLTYRDVDRRTDVVAGELRARGVRPGDAVGLLARNGRGFVETAVALAKCGADVLYLGTSTAPRQLQEVLRREGARLCVVDEEFAAAVPGATTIGELSTPVGGTPPRPPRTTSHTSRQVILTSGTTGAPRGAARSGARLEDAVSALGQLPLRTGGTTFIASPMFHAWGLGQLSVAMVLGSTVVTRRLPEPAQVLADLQKHRVDALVVVPVLLDRLVQLLLAEPGRFDVSSVRAVMSSGGPLPGDLVARTTRAFGPVLHNLYGSTEVAYASVATPADLARDPRSAGRPPRGVRVRLVDDAGANVPAGTPGRIYVGNGLAFTGYTDGTDKDRLDGLVATGDLGVLDAEGRLTVLGRDDDMVTVGGENVFTGQVEDVLLEHPDVAEVAVLDVPDDVYGTRLVAHVVPRRGADVPDPRALQDWVRDRLSRPAVPREVRFTGELPRTASGKVLKRDLRQAQSG